MQNHKPWLVKLEGGRLHVGSQMFDAGIAKRALTAICKNGSSEYQSPNFVLKATRSGVLLVGKGEISWAEADFIHEALSKAGY